MVVKAVHYVKPIATDRSFGRNLSPKPSLIFLYNGLSTSLKVQAAIYSYNRCHFSSRELRFLSHKRRPPRNAFSF